MSDQTTVEQIPAQHQDTQPGHEEPMVPRPEDDMKHYRGSGKLAGKTAIVTGGDSGIGRAVSIGFAKEGADVAVVYLCEHEDAEHTQRQIEAQGAKCLLLAGDVGDEAFCADVVEKVIAKFGRLDILVNNAAEQHPQEDFTAISREQLERTFRTNLFSMFDLTRYALAHLKEDACIVNSTSVTAYRGSSHLIDYSASKGAIVSFTRSLAQALAKRRIRVNAVAPGPIWTPLIPASFDAEKVEHFGEKQPLGGPGQPDAVAPSYIFLASSDSSYMTGQVLHPNGGEIVNG
ncbi:SDR family oxidoreductase [Azoarcus sp. PA01]|nr:SDR family oxidoreductase [Azoarcus sp. PA01]